MTRHAPFTRRMPFSGSSVHLPQSVHGFTKATSVCGMQRAQYLRCLPLLALGTLLMSMLSWTMLHRGAVASVYKQRSLVGPGQARSKQAAAHHTQLGAPGNPVVSAQRQDRHSYADRAAGVFVHGLVGIHSDRYNIVSASALPAWAIGMSGRQHANAIGRIADLVTAPAAVHGPVAKQCMTPQSLWCDLIVANCITIALAAPCIAGDTAPADRGAQWPVHNTRSCARCCARIVAVACQVQHGQRQLCTVASASRWRALRCRRRRRGCPARRHIAAGHSVMHMR